MGIAGGERKCALLTDELGFDAAVDYRASDWREALVAATPDGIDVDFENVGGSIMEAIFARLNLRSRVVLCGLISGYNDAEPPPGPRSFGVLLTQRVHLQGFIVLDHLDRIAEAATEIGGWIREGKLHPLETVVEGFEQLPDAVNMLFDGANTGKLVLRVSDPSVCERRRPPCCAAVGAVATLRASAVLATVPAAPVVTMAAAGQIEGTQRTVPARSRWGRRGRRRPHCRSRTRWKPGPSAGGVDVLARLPVREVPVTGVDAVDQRLECRHRLGRREGTVSRARDEDLAQQVPGSLALPSSADRYACSSWLDDKSVAGRVPASAPAVRRADR